MAISVMGAGCSGQAPAVTDTAPQAPAPVAEVPKADVKFSSANTDLFGIQDKYSAMTISSGTGTCLTKMPYTELSYSPTAAGNNFMLRDKGVKVDEKQSSTPGAVMFDGKTVDGKDVDCILRVPFAGETGALSCADADEKEVCSATYASLMLKPL